MWTTLQNRMDIVQNESGSTHMRDKFHHEKYRPEDTIDQYIGRLLTYQERLVGTKQGLTDEDIITKLLTGLPAQFQVVKKVIFNQPDRTVTSVIAALRRHAEITNGKPIQKTEITYEAEQSGKCKVEPDTDSAYEFED